MLFWDLSPDLQLQIIKDWDGFRKDNPEIARSIIEQFDIVSCMETIRGNIEGPLRAADYQAIEDLVLKFCKSQLFFESYYYPWRFRN